jgi:hypothetical protein
MFATTIGIDSRTSARTIEPSVSEAGEDRLFAAAEMPLFYHVAQSNAHRCAAPSHTDRTETSALAPHSTEENWRA